MYTVKLAEHVFGKNAELTATVSTYRGALEFVGRFVELPILHNLPPVNGRLHVEVYEAFSNGTVVATIVGPP